MLKQNQEAPVRHNKDYYVTFLNRFKKSVQDKQRAYIHDLTLFDSLEDSDQMNARRIYFLKSVLNESRTLLINDINKGVIAMAAGYFTICSITHPDIRDEVVESVKNELIPYARTLAERHPDSYGIFYQKCLTCTKKEHVPYTPEIAAMEEIALSIRQYKKFKNPHMTRYEGLDASRTYSGHSDNYQYLFVHDGTSGIQLVNEKVKAAMNLLINEPSLETYFIDVYAIGSDTLSDHRRIASIIKRKEVEKHRNMTEMLKNTSLDLGKGKSRISDDMRNIFKPVSGSKPSFYTIQGESRNINLKNSMTDEDYRKLAGIMSELANEIAPYKYKHYEKMYYSSLMENPDIAVHKFLCEYEQELLTEKQERTIELIRAMTKTDAPVINENGRLVATRCIEDCVTIGQEGGIIRGNTVIEAGAWVDENSFVKDSHIGSGVILCMNTSVVGSDLRGIGIIANTRLTNCTMSGTYNPYEMRREAGLNPNPVQIMSLNDKDLHFGVEKNGTNMQKKSRNLNYRYLKDFLDKNIGQYLHEQFLRTSNDKPNIIKPNAEQKARKDREAAINQQISQMGQKMAHLEEASRKAYKAAARTPSIKDDLFALSLGGKFGEKLINDTSVTIDMLEHPLSSFGFDFDD